MCDNSLDRPLLLLFENLLTIFNFRNYRKNKILDKFTKKNDKQFLKLLLYFITRYL